MTEQRTCVRFLRLFRQRAPTCVAAALFSLAASSCGPPNPPLLTSDQTAALEKLKSPYAVFSDSSAGATDIMVLTQGEPLRLVAQRSFKTYASLDWPKEFVDRPQLFTNFEHPTLTCPATSPDGAVCSLSFLPLSEASSATGHMAPGLAAKLLAAEPDLVASAVPAEQPVTVRMNIDNGASASLLPAVDPSPPPAPGEPKSRIVYGDGTFGPFGHQTIVCRADDYPGGVWERRNCTFEFGSNQLTVGRDAQRAGAPAFNQASDDPQMMDYLRDAATFLGHVVSNPMLLRALEPVRSGPDESERFMAAATHMPAEGHSAEIRDREAANAPHFPWIDVHNQLEFENACAQAAEDGRRMLIYTADGADTLQETLYQDALKPFPTQAMLVLIQMHPPVGDNPWAKAFTQAIGASKWSTFTVTDKARMVSRNDCELGKVYQSRRDAVRPIDIMQALLTGRPPSPKG